MEDQEMIGDEDQKMEYVEDTVERENERSLRYKKRYELP